MSISTDLRDITRGALASLAGFGGRMLARLALMITAGHLYGAEPLGLLGQVAALVEILAACAVLGLRRSLLDFLSASDSEHKQSSLIKEALIAALIISTCMSITLGLVWPLVFPDTPMPLLLYLTIPAIVFADVGGTAIRYKRIIRWEIIARCVLEPWAFLMSAVALYFWGFTGTGLLTAYAVSCVAASLGISIGLHRAYGMATILLSRIDYKALYKIPFTTLPVGMADIGTILLRRLDILVLSLVAGHQTTGIYYMAQQIVTVPHKIHQLFEPMMAPVLASLHHKNNNDAMRHQLASICRWVFTLQIAITVPFIVFSAEFMGIFGQDFIVGATVLSLLLLAELVDGSFALSETALVFAKPTIPPKLVFCALVVEVMGIYIMASQFGAAGAAAGFLLATTTLAILRLAQTRTQLGIQIFDQLYLIPMVLSFIVGFILYGMRQAFEVHGVAEVIIITLFAVSGLILAISKIAMHPSDKQILQHIRLPGKSEI